MAGMGLSGGYAAGAGADALEDLLKRLFVEGQAKIRNQQEEKRIAQDDRRLTAQDADRDALRQDVAKSRAIQGAGRIAGNLRIGQNVTQPTIEALQAGDLGDLVQHEQADIPSRAISGIAMAGAKAPLVGQLRMAPLGGRPERDTFTGTADQLMGEATRQDSLAARAQAQQDREAMRQDRTSAAEQARQDRIDAAKQAQQDRQENIRLMASLRPPTAAQSAAVEAEKRGQTQQNEVQDALDVISQIRSDPARKSSTGPIEGRGVGYATAGPEGFERVKRLHNNLVDKLALAQAGKLKGQGAISNFEREMLKNAATALSLSLGDKDYETQLGKLEDQFKRMLTTPAGAAPAAGGGAQEFDWVPGKGLVPRK